MLSLLPKLARLIRVLCVSPPPPPTCAPGFGAVPLGVGGSGLGSTNRIACHRAVKGPRLKVGFLVFPADVFGGGFSTSPSLSLLQIHPTLMLSVALNSCHVVLLGEGET